MARAGLHVEPVLMRENSMEDVSRGAKPSAWPSSCPRVLGERFRTKISGRPSSPGIANHSELVPITCSTRP